MSSPFLAALLRQGHPLAARILEFHQYPASYAQPGWIPPELAGAARLPGRRARARISALLLERLGVPAGPLDLEPPGRRLALVDPPALQRAAYLAGLAALAPEMAVLLERRRVLELRMELSADDYRFVLHKARLLTGPEAAAPAATGAEAGRGGWRQRAGRCGLLLLGACFAGAGEALRARLKLKFPPAAAPALAAGAAGAAGETDAAVPAKAPDWRLFRKILLQEVDDSWAPLFS